MVRAVADLDYPFRAYVRSRRGVDVPLALHADPDGPGHGPMLARLDAATAELPAGHDVCVPRSGWETEDGGAPRWSSARSMRPHR